MWDVNALSAAVLSALKAYRLGDADARDVCQEAWLELLRVPGALRDETKLRAWLITTARRRALRLITRNRRETSLPPPDPEATPEADVVRAERDRALWAAVGRLPERHRRLMWLLAHRPELTYMQLAGELGISPASVGRLRRRCFDRLRRTLETGGWA
ncbi:sigma-70 family RNA polymerase sigma factor [Amycolatopsis sp. lyj-112]|uniref:sigma-70 family RNA polymerase sigma factor n=1 Tax=Amycolatopsis sp. lyj-112 TaxID=2789288 RepID=UPI00397D6882